MTDSEELRLALAAAMTDALDTAHRAIVGGDAAAAELFIADYQFVLDLTDKVIAKRESERLRAAIVSTLAARPSSQPGMMLLGAFSEAVH